MGPSDFVNFIAIDTKPGRVVHLDMDISVMYEYLTWVHIAPARILTATWLQVICASSHSFKARTQTGGSTMLKCGGLLATMVRCVPLRSPAPNGGGQILFTSDPLTWVNFEPATSTSVH